MTVAINKNFIVKNGIEIGENLIYTDTINSSVGLGTTIPEASLHVAGGSLIGGGVQVTGVTTTTTKLDVGVGGTVLTVDSTLGDTSGKGSVRVGINTGNPSYTLHVKADTGLSAAGIGYTAVYVDGDTYITDYLGVGVTVGTLDLSVSGVATVHNLRNTGVSTFVSIATTYFDCSGTSGISTINLGYFAGIGATVVNVSGITTTASLHVTGIGTVVTGLVPQTDEGAYLGRSDKPFSEAHISHVRIANGATSNTIDTSAGNLTLDSAGGTVIVNDIFNVTSTSVFNDDVTFTGASNNLYWDKSSDYLQFADNAKAVFGAGEDLQIYHDGTDSIFNNTNGEILIKSTQIKLQSDASGENLATFTEDGSVDLYYNGSKKFETTNTGTNVIGVHVDDGATHDGDVTFEGATAGRDLFWNKAQNWLKWGDNAEANFGTGNDFRIYHNGTDTYLDNNTGTIYIRNNVDNDDGGNIHIQAKSGEDSIVINDDSSVNIYFDNSKKFETTNIGVNVIGHTELDNLNVSGVTTVSTLEITNTITDFNVTNSTVSGILTAPDKNVHTDFHITNNGTTSYEFSADGIGFPVDTYNPTIYVSRGRQYRFNVNASGQPLYIKTSPSTGTGDQYNDGVVGNGAAVGIVTFNVPFNAPKLLYYQSANANDLKGLIYAMDEGTAGVSSAAAYYSLDIVGLSTLGGHLAVGDTSWFHASNDEPVVKITQEGAGDALRVEDAATGESSPFVINSGGNVGIGTTSPIGNLDIRSDDTLKFVIGQASSNQTALTFKADDTACTIESTYNSGAGGAYKPIAFRTGGVDRISIANNGDFATTGDATFNGEVIAGNSNSESFGVKANANSGASDMKAAVYARNHNSGGRNWVGMAYNGTAEANITSSITESGAATFASTIVSGADPYTSTSNVGQRMDPTSGIVARSSGSNQLWTGYATGSGTLTSEIKATGAAYFGANSTIGGYDSTNNATSGIQLQTGGCVVSQSQNDGDSLWLGRKSGVTKSQILTSGAAIFATDVTVSSGHFMATGNSTSTKTFISKHSGTEYATIKADGTAWFNSTVTANTYYGDGSNLTGIDATTIQTGTTKVDTNATNIHNVVSGTTIATIHNTGLTIAGHIDITGNYYARNSNDSTSGNTHGFVCNSSDGIYRHYSTTNARALMNVPTRTGGDASGTWNITAANAQEILVTNTNSNATYYIPFVGDVSGNRGAFADSGLAYNPSSNTLSTTWFSGNHTGDGSNLTLLNGSQITHGTVPSSRIQNISGNAPTSSSCSGNAATATWADTVDVNAGADYNGSYFMVWHSGDELYSTNNIVCNPASDTIYANVFNGSHTGNGSLITNINANNISSGTISAARVPTLNQSTTGNASSSTVTEKVENLEDQGAISVNQYIAAFTSASSTSSGLHCYTSQKFYWNASGTGTLTAPLFSGNLLGNVLGTSGTFTGDVSAANFNSTSDINLKKDIEVVGDPINLLKELKGVKFTWKKDDKKSVGVIAQEVEEVIPELVNTNDEGTKSVNYNGLVGVLIEAVKELTAKVETLENQLNNQ